jgi:tetratricopeptide (TPR) repeat protein
MTSRLLLLALACATALPSCKKKSDPGITVTHETETQRSESVKAAFVDTPAAGTKTIDPSRPEHAELDAFFTKLGKAARNSDRKAYGECISADAMIRHLEAKGMLTFRTDRERSSFLKGAEGSMGNSMSNMAFDRHVISRLEEISPNQVMAFTRTYDQGLQVVIKMRWWLVKEAGTWRAYDFEELSQGIRASTMMGAIVGSMKGKPEPWVEPFTEMAKTMQNLAGDNMLEKLADMEKHAGNVLKKSPPQEIEIVARQMLVAGKMGNGDVEGALEEIEKLEKLSNVSPGLHFQKGGALIALEKPVEARAAFQKYVDVLGWDSDVHEMMADAYMAEDNKKDALDHALKGLADHKDALGCLATAAVASGTGGVGDLTKHFDATDEPEAAYETAIDYALETEDEEVAKALVGMLKEKLPKSDLVEVYEDILSESPEEEMEEDEE